MNRSAIVTACRSSAAGLSLAIGLLMPAGAASAQDAPATTTAQPAPEKFMIAAIDISGVTKLTQDEIERLIYPHLGPDRTNADVIAAQKALQDAYAAKGYEAVQVDIPIQSNALFSQGVVQLVVSEMPVGQVKVVDAKHHSSDVARSQIPSLVEGQPIDLSALQHDIGQANRFPDRLISPKFKAGQTPGTVDVDLQVEDSEPVHANVELNNDNSPNTRSLRLSSTVRYSDLWGQGHTLSITGSLAPQDRRQSAVVSASYSAPLIGTPWSFLLYGYKSNSNVAALGGTNVLGNGYQIGARAIYRLPGDTFQQISFGPDFKSFKENISIDDKALQPTQVRYIPLVAEYAMSNSDENSTFGLTLSATAGLRTINRDVCFDPSVVPSDDSRTCTMANGETGIIADQFVGKAINGGENFVHLNLDMNYMQVLPKDFQMAFRLGWQLSDSSLITNEQFSVGGTSSVRGYYVSEAVGDNGLISSVELRSPNLARVLGKSVDQLRFFTFVDAGVTRIRSAAVGQIDQYRIAGTGVGVRLQLFKYFTGELLIGVPLHAGPVTERGDPRYNFSLKGEF